MRKRENNYRSFPEHQETQNLRKECRTLLYFDTDEQRLNPEKNGSEQTQRNCQQQFQSEECNKTALIDGDEHDQHFLVRLPYMEEVVLSEVRA